MRGPRSAAVWPGPLRRLCSPSWRGRVEGPARPPLGGWRYRRPSEWVQVRVPRGLKGHPQWLLDLLLTLLSPCRQPHASGWVPTGLRLQRGALTPFQGLEPQPGGQDWAVRGTPTRRGPCGARRPVWGTCGLAWAVPPGPPAARPRGRAWAGQGRGQPTHQSAQRGLSAGATKTPRLLLWGPEQSWVPEALAVDPWRPERLRERNMEAITLRAVVWVIPKETPGPVLSKPGARRPDEAIKARILRL